MLRLIRFLFTGYWDRKVKCDSNLMSNRHSFGDWHQMSESDKYVNYRCCRWCKYTEFNRN